MKDIAYYAGFLSAEEQEKINTASHDQLVELLQNTTWELYSSTEFALRDFEYEPEEGDIMPLDIAVDGIAARDQLALIRGLCDRIEVKLMEVAQ